MLTSQANISRTTNTANNSGTSDKIVKIAKRLSIFTADDISVILETPETELQSALSDLEKENLYDRLLHICHYVSMLTDGNALELFETINGTKK